MVQVEDSRVDGFLAVFKDDSPAMQIVAKDQNSLCMSFHDWHILTEGCGKAVEDVHSMLCTAPFYLEATELLHTRCYQRITNIDRILTADFLTIVRAILNNISESWGGPAL